MSFGSSGNLRKSADISSSEAQAKLIQDRVNHFEHDFGNLSVQISSYTQRSAKLRDNGDEMAKILNNYATALSFNDSSSKSLKSFSEHLAAVEDYRHAQVERLAAKIVKPLAEFGDECKLVKADIRNSSAALKKENNQTKKLQKTKEKGTLDKTKTAESALLRASMESLALEKQLHMRVLAFEKKKLEGTKQILSDYVQIEMMWHIKALEQLSEAYKVIQSIDCNRDLEMFRETLHFDAGSNTMSSSMRVRSASQGSLNSSSAGRPPQAPNTLPRYGGQTSTPNLNQRPTNSTNRPTSSTLPSRGASASAAKPAINGTAYGDESDFTDEEEEEEDEDDEDGSEYEDDDGDYDLATSAEPTPRAPAIKSAVKK